MKTFRELLVYQKAVEFAVRIYKVTENFPKSEIYGLVSQIRRCAISIPSNIAEGQRRAHKAEFVQFLRVSFGSGAELETQLLIANKIGFIKDDEYRSLTEDLEITMKMLNKLIRSL